MTDPLAAIAHNKLICTGVAMSYEAPIDPDPRPGTEAAFDALVTQYYKLFREGIRTDVAFLRSVEDSPWVASFDNAVYQLRTAKQHDDNQGAKTFYAAWIRDRSWEEAADAFLGKSAKALGDLERISSLHNVNLRRQRLGSGHDVRAAVEQFCVQEISAAHNITLPAPYYEILDRLGLLGKRGARAALLVAYSVCAATDLTGEAFLQRVEETWRVGSS